MAGTLRTRKQLAKPTVHGILSLRRDDDNETMVLIIWVSVIVTRGRGSEISWISRMDCPQAANTNMLDLTTSFSNPNVSVERVHGFASAAGQVWVALHQRLNRE